MAEQLRRRLSQASDEQERLRAVLQGMVEGVLVLDRSGRVILANPRLRELFGVWGGVEGRSALEVIRRVDVESALAEAARTPEPVVRELHLARATVTSRCMRCAFRRTGTSSARSRSSTTSREIHRLEGVRRDFVANVSHELRTPLTAIRGFAETLRGSEVPAEQRRQYLDVILRHADRLTALIEDLLELSRIEGGTRELSLEPIDVAALARGAAPGPEAAPRRAAHAWASCAPSRRRARWPIVAPSSRCSSTCSTMRSSTASRAAGSRSSCPARRRACGST